MRPGLLALFVSIGLTTISPPASCEANQSPAGDTAPASRLGPAGEDSFTTIHKPTTLVELLQNVKFAVEHDLLLRKEFYGDDSLKRFFGTSRIRWTGTVAQLIALEDQPPNQRPHVDLYASILDQRDALIDAKKFSVGIGISEAPFFSVDVALSVFGNDMEVVDRRKARITTGEALVLAPKTHEFGNAALIYRISRPSAQGTITFITEGDGTVNRCLVHEGEK